MNASYHQYRVSFSGVEDNVMLYISDVVSAINPCEAIGTALIHARLKHPRLELRLDRITYKRCEHDSAITAS